MSSVFPPGVQLATRYRVLRLLETNQVGALFEAERLDTERRVALKWLRFTGGGGTTQLAQQRVARARAAILVRHPQLGLVHDVAHEGSSLFVVSELLHGEPLRARLAPHAMPLHERLRALAVAARALAFAHQKGLVHGGLHPGNIFLHREHEAWVGLPPIVKVHDFGTATSTMPECLAYPAERSALGAHAFLDHAALCGAEPDAQSDIYALAVLVFQALTGSVPYAAQSPIELAVTLATSPVPALGERHVGLPAALDALIHQSLQHERSERPQQLDSLAAEISAYAEALAARALATADDNNQHTRRMLFMREPPGPQVTRLPSSMGDDKSAQPPLHAREEEATAPTPPLAAPPIALAELPTSATPLADSPAPTPLAPLPANTQRAGLPSASHQTALTAAVQQAEFAAAIQQTRLAAYLQHTESAQPLRPAEFVPPTAPTQVAGHDAPSELVAPMRTELVGTPTPPLGLTQTAPQRVFSSSHVASCNPRITLELAQSEPAQSQLAQSERVVEISRHPTVVGEVPRQESRTDAQRAGYVEVVSRTRIRPPLKLAVEPAAPVLGSFARSLQSSRVRAWSAAAVIFALAGISVGLAVATNPDASSPNLPPTLPSVERAQPVTLRPQRAEPPAQRDPMLMDIKSEQPEQHEREAPRPLDEEAVPARRSHRDRVPPSLARGGTAHFGSSLARGETAHFDSAAQERDAARLDTRPVKVEQASQDDGYLVGALPTKDQF